jgi:hypothetical protein
LPALARATLFAVAVYAACGLYLNQALDGVWIGGSDVV